LINFEEYIEIGVISVAHSLTGRVKVLTYSGKSNYLIPGDSLYIEKNGFLKEFKVESFNPFKTKIFLLKLASIETREDAEALKGKRLFIGLEKAEALKEKLSKDSFFYFDLLDCTVLYNEDVFGTVVDIMEAGAGEILVIKTADRGDVMVPFVSAMVDTKRIDEKILIINPVEGLFDI